MSEPSPVNPPAAGPPSAALTVGGPRSASAVDTPVQDGASAADGTSAADGATASTQSAPVRRRRPEAIDVAVWVFLAVISYIPSFLTQPGRVAADTKDYLYLDPGRLIQSAISVWDPDFGAGTVTHQNIGFLFPMGPYYWLVAELHIPMWIGQRFWMGSLFFAAGTGVWYLGRLMGLTRSGRLAAALAYMLTPYVLDYIARISGIVMPWAALGWMMAFTILAVRKGGWRYPALFAVVIALVGRGQRHLHTAGRDWPRCCGWSTRCGEPTRPGSGPALAALVRLGILSLGVSAVVDGRLLGRGGLRDQRPQVHRDGTDGVVDLAVLGGVPGPRLLVLLRHGQAGAVDSGLVRLPPVDLADRRELPRAHPLRGRGPWWHGGATGPSPSV